MHHAESHFCGHAETEQQQHDRIESDFWDGVEAGQNRLGDVTCKAPDAEYQAKHQSYRCGQYNREKKCLERRGCMLPEHRRPKQAYEISERLQWRRNSHTVRPTSNRLPKREHQQRDHDSVEKAKPPLCGASTSRVERELGHPRDRRRASRPSQTYRMPLAMIATSSTNSITPYIARLSKF